MGTDTASLAIIEVCLQSHDSFEHPATLARDAAGTVPGVRVAFGRHSYGQITELAEKSTLGHRAPHAAIGVLGRTAVIDLALAVRYGEGVDEVARQVHQRVITQLRATVGVQDVTVNLTVDDVAA